MNHPTPDEQRELVRRMAEAHREIDRIRREALRGLPYRWEDVDALPARISHRSRGETAQRHADARQATEADAGVALHYAEDGEGA